MVFSSNLFLFAFLPLALLIYYLIDRSIKNVTLLVISLAFYVWSSGDVIYLLLFSIFFNFYLGEWLYKKQKQKALLIIGIVVNMSFLLYFKYLNFFIDQFSRFSSHFGISPMKHLDIFLPAGISFYTFMSISYLVEVYRRENKAQNVIDYGMYLSLFPHLIAGPIVRFSELKEEIKNRKHSVDLFFEGIWIFALGLGKKVIIANTLGEVADSIFKLSPNELTTTLSWVGIICYSFQIYFDFSGYSDMAIGLARMFGFRFPENFNQPYRAANITDFWRRWHMTLSRWFRDFVYIPLGGNRAGVFKMYRNSVIVFFLTGFWHGASWTFVIWGLYHGTLLVLDKLIKTKFKFEFKGVIGTLLTFLLVMIGWVFFRADSFHQAITFITKMFSFDNTTTSNYTISYYLKANTLFILLLAVIFSFVPMDRLNRLKDIASVSLLKGTVAILLIVYCAAILSKAAFNPFIYFRF